METYLDEIQDVYPKSPENLRRKITGSITPLLEESAPCCILNPSNSIQKALFAVDPL